MTVETRARQLRRWFICSYSLCFLRTKSPIDSNKSSGRSSSPLTDYPGVRAVTSIVDVLVLGSSTHQYVLLFKVLLEDLDSS